MDPSGSNTGATGVFNRSSYLAACRSLRRSAGEADGHKDCQRKEILKSIMHANRLFATLLIAKLDRLARNVWFTSTLMESGIDFVACDSPQASRLTIHILAAVAEEEARLTPAPASANMDRADAYAPYGFSVSCITRWRSRTALAGKSLKGGVMTPVPEKEATLKTDSQDLSVSVGFGSATCHPREVDHRHCVVVSTEYPRPCLPASPQASVSKSWTATLAPRYYSGRRQASIGSLSSEAGDDVGQTNQKLVAFLRLSFVAKRHLSREDRYRYADLTLCRGSGRTVARAGLAE